MAGGMPKAVNNKWTSNNPSFFLNPDFHLPCPFNFLSFPFIVLSMSFPFLSLSLPFLSLSFQFPFLSLLFLSFNFLSFHFISNSNQDVLGFFGFHFIWGRT